MLIGVAASPGIGIGKALVLQQEEIQVEKHTVHYLEAEKQRFLDAVEIFVADIERTYEAVVKNVGKSEAAILSAQIAIMRDPALIKEVLRSVERQSVNVEYAFSSVCNGYIALFSNMEDELMRARAADFHDIRNRMLSILIGVPYIDLDSLPPDCVLVAEDIPPSQAAQIDPQRVSGIVTRYGTRYSHIAIIARALQLPAVVAAEHLLERVHGGEILIVDGDNGRVRVDPGERELNDFRAQMLAARKRRAHLEQYRERSTETADGRRISLCANLAVPQELQVIRECRADGVGLFRTEFMFMERKKPPSESEQFESYRAVVQGMDGAEVVIRTLDIGGDKDIPYLSRGKEENPYLGYRAVRFCLDHPDMFRAQIAAILRASVYGPVRMLIPMISSITEIRAVKRLVAQVQAELTAGGKPFAKDVPLGVMVETPAAVLCAPELAREVDFFSIGTNDLTQYVLAVDRGNRNVASLYSDRHPAVLRMIRMTVEAAAAAGIPVEVCGEAAADPILIPLLIGMGIDTLSVSAGRLLTVRSQINNLCYEDWRGRVPGILALETGEEISAFISGLFHAE